MENNKILTVIIPSYNVATYLEETLPIFLFEMEVNKKLKIKL